MKRALVLLAVTATWAAKDCPAQPNEAGAAPRTLAPYFTPATPAPKAPDADGFLQRWLLLEPINKPNRTNTVFTDSYVRNALNNESFPNQFAVIPHDGDKVIAGEQELVWHALDSTGFNVKLFRFAYGLNKTTYGVIFWAVTVVNSPREIQNARMAVGVNGASIWWLNGKEAVDLFTDRRMKMDDCVSKRLTLNKGRNVIRGAVINGPGMSDFCLRFIDENGEPIDVLQSWPAGNIDLRIGDYMMRPHQKWTITPVTNSGGYPGSPYFKIQIADTDRTLAAAAGNEVVTVPSYSGAPEQLWRIDQLTDGTYRIMPKAVPNSTEPVALIAIGASTPTLARFDPKSVKGRWTLRKP